MEDHVDINTGMGLVEGRQSGKRIGVVQLGEEQYLCPRYK